MLILPSHSPRPPGFNIIFYLHPGSVYYFLFKKYVIYIYFYCPNNIILYKGNADKKQHIHIYKCYKFNAKTLVCVCLLLTAARREFVLYEQLNYIVFCTFSFFSLQCDNLYYICIFFLPLSAASASLV